jgi:hypothetical protein
MKSTNSGARNKTTGKPKDLNNSNQMKVTAWLKTKTDHYDALKDQFMRAQQQQQSKQDSGFYDELNNTIVAQPTTPAEQKITPQLDPLQPAPLQDKAAPQHGPPPPPPQGDGLLTQKTTTTSNNTTIHGTTSTQAITPNNAKVNDDNTMDTTNADMQQKTS